MMPADIGLSTLIHAEKDALIVALFTPNKAMKKRIDELTRPPKRPNNASILPARGHARDWQLCVAHLLRDCRFRH